MSDNVLRVGTAVDIGGLQSGMAQAATLVEDATNRMTGAFSEAQKAAAESSKRFEGVSTSLEEMHKHAEKSADLFGKIFEGLKHPFENGNWNELAEGVEDLISHPFRAAGVAVKDLLVAMGPVGAVSVGAAAALFELGKQSLELVSEEGLAARQTQNFATTLGLTFEETKKLSEMAKLVDVDISGLSRAAFQLSETLQNPGTKEAEELRKIGVTATESGPALLQVLERLSQITDGTKRMAEARALLGRAAVSMAPVISDYKQLGEVV